MIDAAEWVSPYNDLAFGFQNIAKYYYYPGWQEPGPTIELIINKTAYNNLPKDLQAIIKVAARTINQDMLDEYTYMNQNALQQLQKQGVEIRPYLLQSLKNYEKFLMKCWQKILRQILYLKKYTNLILNIKKSRGVS